MEFDKAKIIINQQKVDNLLEQLAEPFPEEVLYWKPQAVSKDKTKAIAAVYADPRAYSDRLSAVLGPDKWSVSYQVFTLPPIAGPNPEDWKNKFIYKGKILVVATLVLEGIGQNSDTGEAEATDDNAITAASAQAMKRAATKFGLGRYLYDFPKGVWSPYDDKSKKITSPPSLPEWAVSKKMCADCHKKIEPYQHGNVFLSVGDLVLNSQKKYKAQLCANCQKARAKNAGVGIEAK